MQRDVDLVAVACDRLVGGVVDDFLREMIGALGRCVHAGALAHRLEPREDFDCRGIVGSGQWSPKMILPDSVTPCAEKNEEFRSGVEKALPALCAAILAFVARVVVRRPMAPFDELYHWKRILYSVEHFPAVLELDPDRGLR